MILEENLDRICRLKYGRLERAGWAPRMRHRFAYYTPDDYYESVIAGLVTAKTNWLDVGSGRSLFPSNFALSKELAQRCSRLVGVDPDPTLSENPFVHEKHNAAIEEYQPAEKFDLISLRMVAEHVREPERVLRRLADLLESEGTVVIYTVFKWSPVPLMTRFVPFWIHHPIKRFLWSTDEKDTFPVANKMNTRRTLKRLFVEQNLVETSFHYLDDCRTFGQFRVGLFFELTARRVLKAFRLPYPEQCIIGIYRSGDRPARRSAPTPQSDRVGASLRDSASELGQGEA